MKNFLIIIALLSLFACKKNEPDPVTPDYSGDLVGTYVGEEKYYDTNNSTVLQINSSKTLTVTRVGDNKIKAASFFAAGNMLFNVSSDGSMLLTPDYSGDQNYGSASNNSYTPSTKTLRIYIKMSGTNKYEYFNGVKQ